MPSSYDASKSWRGRSYSGMKVGRSHHWSYRGEWTERKLGPDLWEVDFTARKKRHGKAPAGSGAPVGTEYQWFFSPLQQSARKMDANTYETHMQGLKWKIGFKPASAGTWDHQWAKTAETARQRAIRILEQILADLKADERMRAPMLEAPSIEGARPRSKRKARSRAPARARREGRARKAEA